MASSIIKSSEFSKSQPQVPLVEGDEIVQHSRRMVPISRSQNAFAVGACTGVLITRTPKSFNVQSSEGEKIESRS